MKQIFFICIIGLSIFQTSVEQNTDLDKNVQIEPLTNKNNIYPNEDLLNPGDTMMMNFSKSNITTEATAPILFNKKNLRYNTGLPLFIIENSVEQVTLPAFGGYFHIKSNILFNTSERVTFSFGGGLVRYDTPEIPFSTLKYSVQGSFQYAVTNRMNFRIYGQRLWYQDPRHKSAFIFMNPMFPQSEVGAAISSQMKNIKMDFGTRTIINTESYLQNLNMINTKVSIGF
ncbi:MAG: hypothetical protein JXR82_05755 [Marinifilaceae bacterium]|nr:hypothetical protein [Marinifilaceae bacterium]